MHLWVLAIAPLIVAVFAWLPGEQKELFSRDGVNLFSRKSSYEAGLLSKRFLPDKYGNDKNKIRGVNLGSLFVLENWLADDVMSGWGCNSLSEFNCVQSLNNQAKANSDFQGHWQSWLSASDFTEMISYGLNTVRIPVGYWMYEALVASDEYFPQGAEPYLEQVVGYAKDAGMYVIIDLHGAPGAQITNQNTGQYTADPAFYDSYNYNRTYEFFDWLVTKIHSNSAFSTVGMVELVSEPERLSDTQYGGSQQANDNSLQSIFYPTAVARIREVETKLGISDTQRLHIQMMGTDWGSGNPTANIADLTNIAYDDHVYVEYTYGVPQTTAGYLNFSCSGKGSSYGPTIVSEWSLAVNVALEQTNEWDPSTNVDWYRKWWAAQVMAYEKGAGWVFWTWKTTGSLNDPRWDYQRAVAAGIISTDIDDAYGLGVCGGLANGTWHGNTTSTSGAETSARLLLRMWHLPIVTAALLFLGGR
jgi:aryl-phospho-beta-D-glucosidase BglC (GH1 family)